MARTHGSPVHGSSSTPGTTSRIATAVRSPVSSSAGPATPSTSRLRPRVSNSPAVPARSAARPDPPTISPAEAPSPATPRTQASLIPRTRKSSIPRRPVGTRSPVSPAPAAPPLPGTPASQIRRPRISGNLESQFKQAARPSRPKNQQPTQSPPLPDSFAEAAPAEQRASASASFSEADSLKTAPLAEVRKARDAPELASNGNGHPAYSGIAPTSTLEDDLHKAQQRAQDLEIQYRLLQAEHSRCNPRLERPARALRQYDGRSEEFVSMLLDRDILGTVVRSLPREQRMGLLGMIAEACRPSDIQAQIEMLLRYKELRSGVLARLDDDLCMDVLRYLGRRDLMQLRLVSKRFDRLATSPKLWKALCRELEARWDGTIDVSNYHLQDDGDWLGLYKSLWQREKHWTNGQAQSLAMLSGHTNYVTSLKLSGETLISASYDDTIRIWHLPYVISSAKSVPPPIVIPAKSVSSLDYYAPEAVLVTGSHEVGRACVWREFEGQWKVEKVLSGHLHGTRAVAINAQWLVSVGSDKAIVVWDWRNGTKLVRFGQQTNVCVGMNLLDNFIITATVDGIIRTFSIAKREMLGQFRLSDMAARYPEYADKLKEVGVGALGMLTWFAAEGRFLACATKDIVIRLAWDWANEEEQAELAETAGSPTKIGFPEAQLQTPITPAAARARQSLPGHGQSPRPSSPRTTHSGTASPHPKPTLSRPHGADFQAHAQSVPSTTSTTSKFALGRAPMIVEVLDITGTERGAFEAGRVRIVTSRRLSARAGAERRVLVGTEHVSTDGTKASMTLVPLGGMWDTKGRQVGLQAPSKNPMSLALDHDKLVYGCTDGSIVVAGFVATPSSSASRSA